MKTFALCLVFVAASFTAAFAQQPVPRPHQIGCAGVPVAGNWQRRGLVPWRFDRATNYADGARESFHRGYLPWATTRSYQQPGPQPMQNWGRR